MFVFDLARDLGKTVGELMDQMTEREFVHWVAYAKIKNSKQKK